MIINKQPGYSNIHMWLRTNFGTASVCENMKCKDIGKRFEWALKKGSVYDKNRDNFLQLCSICHKKYDNMGEKVSKSRIERKKKLGYVISPETREKMSKIKIGIPAFWKRKPVSCFDGKNRTYFEYVLKASKVMGVSQSSISNALSGRTLTAGGLEWSYETNK